MKYLLCRPLGGINDTFNQIEKCSIYAERTGRTLVIDIAPTRLTHWVLNLLDAPESQPAILVGVTEELRASFERMDCVPPIVKGRIFDYEVRQPAGRGAYLETVTGERISFDFKKDFDEPLLLHHDRGGGSLSRGFVDRWKVKEEVIPLLKKETPQLSERYYAVHIRSTDLKTNFDALLKRVRREAKAMKVLVCSDSNETLERARGLFPRNQVVTFPDHRVPIGRPTHAIGAFGTPAEFHFGALQLLAEIRAMALSERFFFGSVRGQKGSQATVSGFSQLVNYLRDYRSSVAFFSYDTEFQSRNNPRLHGEMFAGPSHALRLAIKKIRHRIKYFQC